MRWPRQLIELRPIQLFAEYIDWRAKHPSDDFMTELLNVEIEQDGPVRQLTRKEVLIYVSMIAGAGNETTRGSSAGPAKCSEIIPISVGNSSKNTDSFRAPSKRCCDMSRRPP